jgi:membrane-anchored protein YejM (alkaline phosphatase superfamily)
MGRKQSDPFSRVGSAAVRLPPSLPPEAIKFTRKPDVVLLLAESLPAEHLDERTMPKLWARSAQGARFLRHYAGACATYYTLFSLFYGIQAQKLEATVGAGRQALLFPALKANGYQLRILAASCVDWMGLKETVFGQVGGDMETWCKDSDEQRPDAPMLAGAERWVNAADDRPLFLFMFFDGTHFNYHYPAGRDVFQPAWDGRGGIRTATASSESIENRSRNSAHFLDAELDKLLTAIEKRRGRAPLVFFTGDHGEEFRQKGHIGHGSAVTDEQVHVPLVVLGGGVAPGVHDAPTSHVDLVPTLFSLLGDSNPPSRYSDGLSLFEAPQDRFVFTTVGWEPSYAVIGKDLKVAMYAGLASASITDPQDRPLEDGAARMAPHAGRILRALRGETGPAGQAP